MMLLPTSSNNTLNCIVLYCTVLYIFLILHVDHQPSTYEISETIQTKYLRLNGQGRNSVSRPADLPFITEGDRGK